MPSRMRQVKEGDRWIGFAYIDDEDNRRPLSRITGFFECKAEVVRRRIPLKPGDPALAGETMAWMIEGEPHGHQSREPIGVPAIDKLLGRRHFKGAMLVPIKAEEFDAIKKYVMELENERTGK